MGELDGWVCTDPSCNQYRKDISDTKFLFKEDRVSNPETGETQVYESEIDMVEYTWEAIVDACETFGYTAKQVDKWVRECKETALMAECIFELET